MSSAMLRDLVGAQARHQRVVRRLVADVAGAVLLLEAADPCWRPGVPGSAQGRAQALVAEVGQELAARGSARSAKRGRSRAGRPRRGVARAPRSWRGRCRRAGSPASGSVTAIRTASTAASKHWAGVEAATIGSGDSPWRPWIAISRSAASVLVGIPVEGPARWTSIDHQRQLEHDRQADRLGLQVHAGAAGRGDAELAAEGGAERHVGGGDLVLGLHRAHPEALVAGELVQELRGGRDRVAGENSGSPLRTLAAISPSASAVVPLTLRYVPGSAGAGLTSYV